MALAPEKGGDPLSGEDHRRLRVCYNCNLTALLMILAQKSAISSARITLSVFPVVFEAKVLAVAVVKVAGLGVF